jgi:hypothetical protein
MDDNKPDQWRNVRDGIGFAVAMLLGALLGVTWFTRHSRPEELGIDLAIGAVLGLLIGGAAWNGLRRFETP